MIEVTLRDNESVEGALRVFKRKVARSGVLREVRRRTQFMKPSEAKHIKQKAAASRRRRDARIAARGDF